VPALLVLALIVRAWGLGFGLPFGYARPDETAIAGPAVGFLSGDLRPPFLQWPTLFSYVTAFLYVIYGWLLGPIIGYATLADFADSRYQSLAPFLYITRGLSMTMGVVTVWAVYALSRRVFDGAVAWAAALFIALAYLHVRDSHFGVTDVSMTALVVLTVLAITRWTATGRVRYAALAGAVAGLAASTKYNGLGVALTVVVAAVVRVYEAERGRQRWRAILSSAAGLILFASALAITFLGTSPYVAIDWQRFVRDIDMVQSTLAIGHGMVIGRGWWYYPLVILPAGLGWPIMLAGTAGMLVLLWTRPRQSAVLLSFPLAYYAYAGSGLAVFARYILPVVPFLCITAAWFTVWTIRAIVRTTSPVWANAAIAVVALLMVAPTARQTLQADRLLAMTDNRVIASRAIPRLVPPESVVCQTGGPDGRVPFALEGRPVTFTECDWDDGAKQFTAQPGWVVVQRSPLVLYSAVPEALEHTLRREFELVARYPTELPSASGGTAASSTSTSSELAIPDRLASARADRLYDQQDAFFVPLRGLDGLERPGPEFDLYRRKP